MTGKFLSFSANATGFVSPLGIFEVRPSSELNYTINAFDAFEESGTRGSNLSVDSRIAQTLSARHQIGLGYTFGGFDAEFRGGIDGRMSSEEDYEARTIHTTAEGVQFSDPFTIDHADAETFLGGFVGVQAMFALDNGLTLKADAEYLRGAHALGPPATRQWWQSKSDSPWYLFLVKLLGDETA